MVKDVTRKDLPKAGDHIPVDKFHVSEVNVRSNEAFGESAEDQQLIANLRQRKVVQPFKAKPEGKGYGVFVGRRRFLAKKIWGTKHFVVGVDCIIEDANEEEAREASLIENLEILRKKMNPIDRAKQLNDIITFSTLGLRGTARRLGIPASTLSDWLKILELSPRMQEAVKKESLSHSNALMVARMNLGETSQDKLAETLETEGLDAFKRELARNLSGKMKKGMTKGKYIVLRTIFDKIFKPDVELYEKLAALAEEKNMKLSEYSKWVLTEHAKNFIK